jgi:hypothetical protein
MVFAYVVFFLCVATRLTMGMDVDFLWLYFDGFWLWACVYNFGVEPVFPTLYFGDRLWFRLCVVLDLVSPVLDVC